MSAPEEQTTQTQTEPDASTPPSAPTPVLSVVRGAPNDVELAALLAVVAALGGDSDGNGNGDDGADTQRTTQSGWTDRSRYVRGPVPHFPGGWRASALPR